MSALNEKIAGKVFLFDVDGTLADSMPTATKVVLSYLDERGISYPDDLIRTLTPLGFLGAASYYEKTLKVGERAEEIFRAFSEKLQYAYAKVIPLKAGARETLLALKKAGARICVLTGSPHTFIDECMRRTGVSELAEYIWSSDDFGKAKSDPTIFADAAGILGVEVGELVMVDDNVHVLRAAKSAGAAAVGVFDDCTADDESEMREVADLYVRTLVEIL